METFLKTSVTKLSSLWGVLVCLLVVHLISRIRRMPKGLRLPPGPPGKFIIGNTSDIPTKQEWVTFTQWGKTYGELVHLKAFNLRLMAVNSINVAHELFDQRSSLYSDRVQSIMLDDLMGFGWSFGFMRYGERWRRHRRAFNQHFNQTAVVAYESILSKHARNLVKRLHESPHNFLEHIRHLSGASIMEIVYGINVLPHGDPYIKTAEDAVASLGEAGKPGAFLVDIIPILKYVPPWAPGAGFRQKAREWKTLITKMAIEPLETVKIGLATGSTQPSVAALLLEGLYSNLDVPPDGEEVVRNVAGVAYAGGADTTVSAISTFFLAMVLYPNVQRKAQEELDGVIGSGRLPEFGDRQSLPYVNALCKEILRWHAIVPLGAPHRVTKDDAYRDFFIPEGTVIVGNCWAMLQDEKTFGPETDKFVPERFLKTGVRDPSVAFGFGRRICPGRHFADKTIFITVATVLKALDITRATDDDGKQIPVKKAFTSGFLSYPEPFQCSITLRAGLEKILPLSD